MLGVVDNSEYLQKRVISHHYDSAYIYKLYKKNKCFTNYNIEFLKKYNFIMDKVDIEEHLNVLY